MTDWPIRIAKPGCPPINVVHYLISELAFLLGIYLSSECSLGMLQGFWNARKGVIDDWEEPTGRPRSSSVANASKEDIWSIRTPAGVSPCEVGFSLAGT